MILVSRDFPHVNNTWALGMSALPPSKRAKLVSDDTLDDASGVLEFEKFSVKKVLFQNPSTKSIGVKGTFTDTEPRGTSYAVIVAEKQPLTETGLTELFSSSTKISRSFQNDIYAQYVVSPLEGNCTGMRCIPLY